MNKIKATDLRNDLLHALEQCSLEVIHEQGGIAPIISVGLCEDSFLGIDEKTYHLTITIE